MVEKSQSNKTNPSRLYEQLALTHINSWVGVRGIVFDTSSSGEPDFRIEYIDGRIGIGEIGWHEDPVERAAWAAVHKSKTAQIIDLPKGYGSWALGLVRGANIKRLNTQLHEFISHLLTSGVSELDLANEWSTNELYETAKSFGIEYIYQNPDRKSDRAIFFLQGSGGAVPSNGNLVVPWIESVLRSEEYKDSWEKLDRHEKRQMHKFDEKHVFIIVGSRTDFGIYMLMRNIENNLPGANPKLPGGVTHIWIMGNVQGANPIVWSMDQGWSIVKILNPSN